MFVSVYAVRGDRVMQTSIRVKPCPFLTLRCACGLFNRNI
jgi:hypothetical protein